MISSCRLDVSCFKFCLCENIVFRGFYYVSAFDCNFAVLITVARDVLLI